jgi:hypothetical protein
MSGLTIFSNFYIDSSENFNRLKESYYSFCNADISKWVINIRGRYKEDVRNFLESNISQEYHITEFDSKEGWFFDTNRLVGNIETEYILIWIEDHICTCSTDDLDNVISNMKICEVEYIDTSWYGNGKYVDEYKNSNKIECNDIYTVFYDRNAHLNRVKYSIENLNMKKGVGVISLCSVLTRELFIKILESPPMWRRHPKETPFDFEKEAKDTWILPIKRGIPKYEIFASIDDDARYPGTSLISRGLYKHPIRTVDENIFIKANKFYENSKIIKIFFPKKFLSYILKYIYVVKNFFRQLFYQF